MMQNRWILILLPLCMAVISIFVIVKKGYVYNTQTRNDQRAATLHYFYQEVSRQGLEGQSVFLGSSLIQAFNVSKITPHSLNFGIGGERIDQLQKRITEYPALGTAKNLFIQIGGNDLTYSTDAEIQLKFQELAAVLPKSPQIYWSALLPVTDHSKFIKSKRSNERLERLSLVIRETCKTLPHCIYVPIPKGLLGQNTHSLASNLHRGDGLHLNAKAYKIWRRSIVQIMK